MKKQDEQHKKRNHKAIALAGLILGGALTTGFTYAPPECPVNPVKPASEKAGNCAGIIRVIQDIQEQAMQQEYNQDPTDHNSTMDWNEHEVYMLAKLAMAEAEGEDIEGKALVIRTVLNRVESDEFPDTIEEVISEKNAFTFYSDGRYASVEPNEDCYGALEMVQVDGWDKSRGALYFERTTDEETWHNSNLKELFKHVNHTFYTEK